jgi:hypothetical protein
VSCAFSFPCNAVVSRHCAVANGTPTGPRWLSRTAVSEGKKAAAHGQTNRAPARGPMRTSLSPLRHP